jgi:DNA-binding transcriptional LysR family regulator
MNKFEELESFVAVVDSQGFARAGDRLGMAKSMVSRRVSELEKRLGVQLLQRTTRRQSLTEAGEQFYQRAQRLLADLNEAEQFVADAHCKISGRIKLAAPMGLGVDMLSEPVCHFMAAHADIKIDINLNDRQVDLIKENIDLAIRIGDLEDSSLVARKLARVKFVVCASPKYLAVHGEPQHPAELGDHEVLVYSNVAAGRQWHFQLQGKRTAPRINYRLSANNGDFLARMASLDMAIVGGPLAFMRGYIERGELVPILTAYPRPDTGMYAVYPSGRLVSKRVKLLSDFLHEYFSARGV